MQETDIIAGCVRNERKWQEILYRRHFQTMMQMVLRHTDGDRDPALEIVNDGFLKVFKNIQQFAFKGSLEGWIRRIVFHAMSDYFRANGKHLETIVLTDYDLLPTPQNPKTTEGGLTNLFFEDLMGLVEQLPPATREVFRLYAIEGFNHIEIGEQLNISVGTSKWHLSNAREKLKEMIKES
jgi:RNA polymerase sigma factor (sigma-70 family)